MAAYAALNSVMYILQQIQNHPRPPITLEKQHMDSLSEIISYLQDFLEKYSHRDIGDGKEALESQIANAVYAAEDVLETRIVNQIIAKSKENNFIHLFCRGAKKMIRTLTCSPTHKTDHQIRTVDRETSSNSLFCQDLQKVIEDMHLIKKEVIDIQEKILAINDDQPPIPIISVFANISGSSTVRPPTRKNININTMVGFDDVLIEIMDRLTGHQTTRQILPIVGMGGIGKTTLARNVYDHQYIMSQFDVRIWVTISQEYGLQDIFLEALSCLQNDKNMTSEDDLGQKKEKKQEDELENKLYKSLCGRRYLIVLDDMWSIEAWEKLMLFFPDNNNGSRIMITTRLSDVSNYFESCSFKMNFLDEDKSWDLFCKTVFPQDQCCPSELEEIGKKIAINCKGLPLSIAVVGGLLVNSEKTRQHWEYIAENLNRIVNSADDMHCLKILYLSYNHLPIHLKPCFLYMGVFPEDATISVSRLKNLWVAEGFLKPKEAKSLEEVAEEYLKDLIDRNLILVHELGSSGRVKYCKIHDLLRDLCLSEAKKEKFLSVSTVHDLDKIEVIQSQRIIIHKAASYEYWIDDRILKAWPYASLARSLIWTNCDGNLLSLSCRLVRVFNMDSYSVNWGEYSIKEILQLVNSRYLHFRTRWRFPTVFPSSIHLLWNLQTLIIRDHYSFDFPDINVPPEIWEMPQLRYLVMNRFSLPDPPNVPLIHDDYFILRNLQTIKKVRNLKLSEEVIKRIPNIQKLSLCYEEWGNNYCLNNLGLLNKLESLSIDLSARQIDFALPHSLKKLTLLNTKLLSEDMRMIGSLPHLQVLKLKRESFKGSNWNPIEGEFLCLKFLQIERCFDLVNWNANRTHFPCLEKLHLCYLNKLKEIPWDIGHISTLQSIELWYCSDSAVMSVKNLLDERVGLGNEDLQVRVKCQKDKQFELVSLRSHNFQVQSS